MKTEELRLFIRREIADFLREMRIQAGLSLNEAADKIGYTPSQLEEHEKAEAAISTPEMIRIVTVYHGTRDAAARFLQELSAEVNELMKPEIDSGN